MPLCQFCEQLGAKRPDPRVAVFGGGIAGMTAAHELVERGFAVDLFESGKVLGGLAATQPFESERIFGDEAKDNPLPGEHGFRAFYSFYRHLTDTMERIPVGDHKKGEKPFSVADNLMPTYKVAVALEDDIFREIQYDRRQPRSVAAASYALGVWMVAMGFPSSDIVRLQTRLLQFMTSCRERRYHQLTRTNLLAYLGKDDLSERFQQRFANISRFLIAIDPAQGDALTQAMIMCRLLMDPVTSGEAERNVDRVLNGPTSEAWLDPWTSFLLRQGVRVFFNQELDYFVMNGAGNVVDAHVTCGNDACDYNPRGYLLNDGRRPSNGGYRYFVSAIAGNKLAEVLSETPELLAADTAETARRGREDERLRRQTEKEKDAAEEKYELLARQTKTAVGAAKRKSANAESVLARQDFVQKRRDAWLKNARADANAVTGDPDLQSWVDLVNNSGRITDKEGGANYRPWMSGIQYYLSDNLTILPGHIHFPDAKWALTAVCQSQFWGGDFFWRYGKGKVRSIISVDICEFNTKGEQIPKKALQCSKREIALEVWHQMKQGLRAWDMVLPEIFDEAVISREEALERNPRARRAKNAQSGRITLRPAQHLFGDKSSSLGPPPVPLPYLDHHLDERIIFKRGKIDMDETSIQYFVPGEKSWTSRPGPLPPLESWDQGYRVRLGSLVIVGSFAQTFTSINTMEAANESARHGVNALLGHYENTLKESEYVHFERCTVWPLEADEPADLDFWKQVDRNIYWDDRTKMPKGQRKPKDELEEGEEQPHPPHLFEILQLDRWLEALLPNHEDIDNTSFSGDKLWDSDGWKRFERNFGGLWDKLLTLGRFSSPYSSQ